MVKNRAMWKMKKIALILLMIIMISTEGRSEGGVEGGKEKV